MRLLNAMSVLITVQNLKYKTIFSYCLKCRKNTKNINPKISVSSNGKTVVLLNSGICVNKKSKFMNIKK